MGKVRIRLIISLGLLITLLPFSSFAWQQAVPSLVYQRIPSGLYGRIILAVEEHGEAFYVNPLTKSVYELRKPSQAFEIMRMGLGITNENIRKIPIGGFGTSPDSDGDKLPDVLEETMGTLVDNPDTDGDGYLDGVELLSGYDPLGRGKLSYDDKLVDRLSGYILIQIQANGEAWYVNPVDKKRYFLSRPFDAFLLMKRFGLGVSTADLRSFGIERCAYADLEERRRIYVVSGGEDDLPSISFEIPEYWGDARVSHPQEGDPPTLRRAFDFECPGVSILRRAGLEIYRITPDENTFIEYVQSKVKENKEYVGGYEMLTLAGYPAARLIAPSLNRIVYYVEYQPNDVIAFVFSRSADPFVEDVMKSLLL